MKLSSYCMYCLVKRQMENIAENSDEEMKTRYMKEVLAIISEGAGKYNAPVITSKISKLHQEYFNKPYSFENLKKQYNSLMLEKESEINSKVINSEDKLLCALKYSRVGNYIDFGAMGTVEDNKLEALLDSAPDEIIDAKEYTAFINDLKKAKNLVFLTDNCGEVVLDKILLMVIKELFPELSITVIVRGKPVLNDATMEDAQMVGLTDLVRVLGNGTEVAGTYLEEIDKPVLEVIHSADLIISKGQGNFETLHGCGLNIYYLFLCKCDWFVKRFMLEQFKGVFINEKNLNIE